MADCRWRMSRHPTSATRNPTSYIPLVSWRRGEGVEPSRDLTAPRLALKTSGATGRLPPPETHHPSAHWPSYTLGIRNPPRITRIEIRESRNLRLMTLARRSGFTDNIRHP